MNSIWTLEPAKKRSFLKPYTEFCKIRKFKVYADKTSRSNKTEIICNYSLESSKNAWLATILTSILFQEVPMENQI